MQKIDKVARECYFVLSSNHKLKGVIMLKGLKSTTPNLEEILDKIMEAIDEGADEGQLKKLISKGYENLIGKHQPIVRAALGSLPLIGRDVAGLIVALVKFGNDIVEDQGLKAELSRMRRNRAKMLFDTYCAYREAGFGRILSAMLVFKHPKLSVPSISYNNKKGGT